MADLKFDSSQIDTKLAEEYFTKYNKTFSHIGAFPTSDNVTEDRSGNKIVYTGEFRLDDVFDSNLDFNIETLNGPFFIEGFETVAKQIEENIDLICQIEYITRGLKPDGVKNDIKLLVNNLMYYVKHEALNVFDVVLAMSEDTPLAMLGYVAQMSLATGKVFVEATVNTAAVCHFFVQLCRENGIPILMTIVEKHYQPLTINLENIEDLRAGCVGVVTEHSDLDSAVDTFLGASTTYPWRIRRVLVQESIYERFTKTIAWKAGDNQNEHKISQLCKHCYKCGNKVFAFEYAGERTHDHDTVFVEAYRTNKELINLLNTSEAFCVTLWSSDISEANEIAFANVANFTWINDYANFDGPIKTSQGFYSIIDLTQNCIRLGKSLVKDMLVAQKKWVETPIKVRRNKIVNAINSYEQTPRDDMDKQSLTYRRHYRVMDSEIYKFIDIDNGKMFIGMERPLGLTCLFGKVDLEDVIKSALFGNALLVRTADVNTELLKGLAKEGVPVKFLDYLGEPEFKAGNQKIYGIKIVWTNFGTTFAN